MAKITIEVPGVPVLSMPKRVDYTALDSGVLQVADTATKKVWYWFGPTAWKIVDFRDDIEPPAEGA